MAFAPFNAFTDGKVAWAKLPDVHDRLMVGDRCVVFHAINSQMHICVQKKLVGVTASDGIALSSAARTL